MNKEETKNIITMIIISILLVIAFSLIIYVSVFIVTGSFNPDITNKIFDNYIDNILQYNMR
jgi:hypothetical protein